MITAASMADSGNGFGDSATTDNVKNIGNVDLDRNRTRGGPCYLGSLQWQLD